MRRYQERPIASCPNCGAEASNRSWREVTGGNSAVRIRSDAHQFNGSAVMVLVCKKCGYVQFFTDPQDFH